MTFYDEMRDVARDVLAEFKQGKIEYVRLTPGNGPVDNPGPSQPTPFEYDATARGVAFKYVQNGLAVASDLQATLAVRDDVTPDISGFIRIDGKQYKIVQVINIPPAGVTVAHVVIFRK